MEEIVHWEEWWKQLKGASKAQLTLIKKVGIYIPIFFMYTKNKIKDY